MKKFMKTAFVTAFVAIAGYNVYSSQKTNAMSDLVMANIEALANETEGETGVSCTATTKCGNGSVSCTGVSGCVSYDTYAMCCDANGTAHYSYCGC